MKLILRDIRQALEWENEGLKIDLSEDPGLKSLVIHSKNGLKIHSISSKEVTNIDISGSNLAIKNLCVLVNKTRLENLSSVNITNATIVNFGRHQFLDCDDGNSEDAGKPLKVRLTHSDI